MGDRLTPLDASFLEIEQADDASHMHIGWAMVFDPIPGDATPTIDQVRAHVEERLDSLPRFRARLSGTHVGGLSWPAWNPADLLDLRRHVRHATLPAPGGDAELADWMSDYYSHRLDRARPLWEITFLDGLEGGRWALVTKIHHCLIDGVSGSSVTAVLLDGAAPPGRNAATREREGHEHGFAYRSARAGLGMVRHPRRATDIYERSAALAEFLVKDELVPAPRTSLNVPIGSSRRLAFVTVSLDKLKAVKRQLGGSVNDVVLAGAAGGLRYLFETRGEQLPERGLRVMVPVSLRSTSELLSLGNRVSSLFVELPLIEPDPIARYRKIVETTSVLKESGLAGGAETLMDVAGIVPPAIHAQLARLAFTPRLFNVTITNVPGEQQTLYAFGAPMRRVIPMVPIFANHALGFAITSYDGELVFGLVGDHAAMPDIDVLAEGVERELYELEDIVGVETPAKLRGVA
jgi:diacylglycerol O-acyltransferase / wax synthase